MSQNRAGTVMSATALIASAIALIKSQRVSAAELTTVTLDKATQDLLVAIAAATGETLDTVKSILDKMIAPVSPVSPVSPGGTIIGYALNLPSGITGRITISQVPHAYRLPAIDIDDDYSFSLKAWPTNAGLIYVGFSDVSVTNQLEGAWPLILNEAISYRVQRASALYVGGTVVGDSVTYSVEQ